jgi:hypothetical protein
VRIAVWDLDNCLSDDGWRIPFIDWSKPVADRYTNYHRLCFRDSPGNLDRFAETNAARLTPMFITGRPESARGLTMAWLHYHFDIISPMLMMRADYDHRPSVQMKCEALTQALTRFSDSRRSARIEVAYDDHPAIVEMYRTVFDIDARVLSIHDVDAYKHEEIENESK